MVSADEILKKYSRKIDEQVQTEKVDTGNFSREFLQFKKDMLPELSRYESFCNGLGDIIKIKIAKKDEEKIQKNIDIAHLNVTANQVLTLAILAFAVTFVIGVLLSLAIYLISGSFSFLLLFLFIIASLFLFYYAYSTPARLANSWRLKASSQMVPCILYVVAYMKHTSNLERAIAFASQHLQPPLALDFRKIFWDVETGKFSTIKESLDAYLETWREYSVEFIESFHLIESSLYEPSEEKRISVLERALQVILDGVYEKMLKYTREIRGPLSNLYMLGIVLPTLGVAILPLASALLGDMIKWYHVFVFLDIIIPFFVFYMTSEVMLKRPGGYGETELLEANPLYPAYKSKKPYFFALAICLPIFIIGILPFIFHFGLFGLPTDFKLVDLGLGFLGKGNLFDFKPNGTGPFGLVPVLLSLLVPLSIALFFIISYRMKTTELIKARNSSKQLEEEFTNSLFQLGNRLGDGMPAEVAFANVSQSTRGLVTENFFRTVNINIQNLGMSLEQALFNPKRGAIIYYPSALINISMKILVESVKKGLGVAARALMSISEYIKNIHKINERLRDLLAEVVSDMQSNMTFLAPLLAGIVVGLGSMITSILGNLESSIAQLGASGANAAAPGIGSIGTLTDIFKVEQMIPPYFLQISIGIYIIEIIFILTSTLVTIDAGEDKLKTKNETGKNLLFGMSLYVITAFVSILLLSILAIIVVGGAFG